GPSATATCVAGGSLRFSAGPLVPTASGKAPTGPWRVWAELGYPPGDPSLRPVADQVVDWLLAPRHLKPPSTQVFPGQENRVRRCASMEGLALWYLHELGLADDRADVLADRLVGWQWPDGGWNCDKNPTAHTSSVQETLLPLRGLARHAQAGRAVSVSLVDSLLPCGAEGPGRMVPMYVSVRDVRNDSRATALDERDGKYVPQASEMVFKAVGPLTSARLAHADGRTYPNALVTLDREALGRGRAQGLSATSYGALTPDPATCTYVRSGVDVLNARLNHWETINGFRILDHDLTLEDGDLTPGLKVRRKVIESRYRPLLDPVYDGTASWMT
ncbi:MAG: hypothetical protein WCG47_22310, partial [Dermatophilaceae bacterium]